VATQLAAAGAFSYKGLVGICLDSGACGTPERTPSMQTAAFLGITLSGPLLAAAFQD
jgi:hypothetical protein